MAAPIQGMEQLEYTYENLIKKHPELAGVISERIFDDFDEHCTFGDKLLEIEWAKNDEPNLPLLKKHGSIHHLRGLGKNKAVIAVGAGPSFNNNKRYFYEIAKANQMLPLELQPFIIVASNHMFKPLLKQGVIPHFVCLIDPDDRIYPQLCEDLPADAKKTVLLMDIRASHTIAKEWDEQGRHLGFFLCGNEEAEKRYNELTEQPIGVFPPGGNVINCIWMMSITQFQSTVFIAIGNDCAYPMKDTDDERKKVFYADGQFLNTKRSGHLMNKKKRMGFRMHSGNIVGIDGQNKSWIELEPMLTSPSLYQYKKWVEIVSFQIEGSWHYFNCSESGILGVLAHDETPDKLQDPENYYMLDDINPRFHTTTLENAVGHFLEARRKLNETAQTL